MLNDTNLAELHTLVLLSLLQTTRMLLDPQSVNVSDNDRDAAMNLQSRLLVELHRRNVTLPDAL